MADAATTAMGAVPFRVTDPERIPVKRYYDEEFYRLECEKLWPRVWQMACRLEQIPDVGDWVEYSNLGKSVIIVRTRDGVKAFHNACRHRGVQLAARPRQLRAAGLHLPVPRLALEHGWQEHLRLWPPPVQRGTAGRGRPCPEALSGRIVGRLRLHQPRRQRTAPARMHRAAGRAARSVPGRQAAFRMVVCHRGSGQLEDRHGSLHGRLSRDADPPAAPGRCAGAVQRDLRERHGWQCAAGRSEGHGARNDHGAIQAHGTAERRHGRHVSTPRTSPPPPGCWMSNCPRSRSRH